MLIADFIHAMEKKDYKAMSQCFASQCRLFDYCTPEGTPNFFVYGRRAMDMFYHNKFLLERTVNFYINYGGIINHAVANIESYDSSTGLIKEMVIRPA